MLFLHPPALSPAIHLPLKVATSVKRTESSVETRNVVAGNEGPSRFMAGSRAALQDDPVQSFIVHQSATLFTTLWKLLPNMVNCARTRGPTCIIVFEGEIKQNTWT